MDRYFTLSADRFVNVTMDDGVFNVRIEDAASCFQENIDLTAASWKNLCSVVVQIDKEIERLLRGDRVDVEIHVGRKVYVTLIMDYMYVDLRDFYFSERRSEILPSARGIALSFDEWNNLKDLMPEILEEFPILNSVLLCHENPTHYNLEGALNCFECNFFHNDMI